MKPLILPADLSVSHCQETTETQNACLAIRLTKYHYLRRCASTICGGINLRRFDRENLELDFEIAGTKQPDSVNIPAHPALLTEKEVIKRINAGFMLDLYGDKEKTKLMPAGILTPTTPVEVA